MSTIWGNGTSGTSIVNLLRVKKTEPPRVTILFGRIPAGQDVSSGFYNDTLIVTILW